MTAENSNMKTPKIVSLDFAKELVMRNTIMTKSTVQAIFSVKTNISLEDSLLSEIEPQQAQAIIEAS
jgi:hypothetical protein